MEMKRVRSLDRENIKKFLTLTSTAQKPDASDSCPSTYSKKQALPRTRHFPQIRQIFLEVYLLKTRCIKNKVSFFPLLILLLLPYDPGNCSSARARSSIFHQMHVLSSPADTHQKVIFQLLFQASSLSTVVSGNCWSQMRSYLLVDPTCFRMTRFWSGREVRSSGD